MVAAPGPGFGYLADTLLSPSTETAAPRVGYLALLRSNAAFRNLWLGEVVSLAGDWFTSIALFSMLLEFTGRGEAVGFVLIARFLPALVLGPMAGVFADRYSRRTIMIVCDLARVVVVLGFLFIRDAGDVWAVYALTFVQLSLSAFFETAENAAVGGIVSREEIVTANALQGITWSTTLAVGALLGGLVTSVVGRDAAFCIDSASYLLSAFFIGRSVIPHLPRPWEGAAGKGRLRALLGLDELQEGIRFVLANPRLRQAVAVKAGWGLAGGGAIMLYSVFGERVFPVGHHAANGIGLLYGARGVGALVGPLLARGLGDDGEASLKRAISLSFFVTVVGYGLLAVAPNVWVAAGALVVVHSGAATSWVFSTALINLFTPDALRGRAFAADTALMTVAIVLSILATGAGLDRLHLSPRVLMGALAAVMVVPAVLQAVGRSTER